MQNLEQYLRDTQEQAFLGYQLKIGYKDAEGRIHIYIHPNSVSGETLDFIVDGNTLIPKR
jgi:hypothetical protein